jgi:MoaA/NifB/PqqE/SkfB family radical SAM enzyme
MTGPRLDVLYRGPLSSCNYDCGYCPFAKRASSRSELARDRKGVERFVGWAARLEGRRLGVLFTPWGEALIRRHYREAMVELSRCPHVATVCAQTNLSCDLGWLGAGCADRLALWATYHPGHTPHARFVAKCAALARAGIRFSVGIVGLPAHLRWAERLRRELPDGTTLWVNAAKSSPPLDRESYERFRALDPLFPINAVHHASRGAACRTGERVISVDGDGDVRRCHFVPDVLGNLYRDRLEDLLGERPCPNAVCGCHIGYVHLDRLGLRDLFGEGVLERIPARAIGRVSLPVL